MNLHTLPAALMAERLGIEPTRETARKTVPPSEKSRRAFKRVFPRRDRAPRGLLHNYYSEFFD
jgi:hypothetical protein